MYTAGLKMKVTQ